jgi:hypothetical protein
VLPIWEGTTNVLSLDLLRAESKDQAVTALLEDLAGLTAGVRSAPGLVAELVERSREALLEGVRAWPGGDGDALQERMRGFALRLGRTYAAALLAQHAAHRLATYKDDRAAQVARRYAERWLAGPAGATADGQGPSPGPALAERAVPSR